MILNDIVADDLGPGTDNPQRIAALRDRLATLHPDGVPFLLLPVRLETRFMRVDRPLTTPPADPFVGINGLRAQLDAIATRDFATQLLPGRRDAMKLAELAHARFLDVALAAIQAARLTVLTSLRNSGQLSADVAVKLRAAADGLGTSCAAALASVTRLRSEHQRTTYTQALTALQKKVVAPIQDEIGTVTAPRLELMTALRTVPAKDVLARINGLRNSLAAVRPGAGVTEFAPAHVAPDGQLRGLRDLSHGLLQGTRAELDELRAAWEPLASDMNQVRRSMAAARAGGGEAADGLASLLPDLAALGKSSPRDFETLTNLRLERSARAITAVDVQMDRLAQLLASKPAPASRRGAQALTVVTEAMAIARRVDALLREVPILPLKRYRAGVERFERIAAALAPWRAQVAALALRRLPEAQVLIRDGDAALAALKRSVLSQRSDAWDGGAAPLAGARRKLFVLDTRATHTVDELWVRIFPDDIAVHTHEPGLTEDEKRDGQAFWVETVAAGGDVTLERGAWRALAQRHGSPRAAWIARSLQPAPGVAAASYSAGTRFIDAVKTLQHRIVERASRQAGIERGGTSRVRKMVAAVDAAIEAGHGIHELTPAQRQRLAPMLATVRDQLDARGARLMQRARFAAERDSRLGELDTLRQKFTELETLAEAMRTVDPHDAAKRHAALAFAEVPDKAGPWTTAPHCPSLPERFVVLAVSGDRVVHAVAGETVGDVSVGLDPDPNAPGEIFALDEDGNLLAGDSIRWMIDFDEARAKGLALCVPISIDEAAAGFDELLVLGVREASAADALVLVQNLIDNHHYTDGMAFLPIGSATNNTEAMAAARRSDADPDQTFEVERGAPLFDAAPTSPLDAADGLRFARALGLDASLVAHIDEAGGRDASDAATMNGAFWPATIGAYIEEFLGSLVLPDTAHRLRSFFREHVSARGWLPAFRVGQQPYGVLTTTAFSRFVPDGGDVLPPLPAAGPAVLGEAERQHRFDILLRDLLSAAASDWSRIRAAKVKHVHSAGVTDPQRHFMDILGLSPASVAAEYRFALNVGSRHPTSVSSNPQLPFGFSPLGPAGFFEHFDAWLRRAYGLPAGPFIEKGLVTAPLRAFFELLSDERAYSVRVLDKARSVRGAVSGAGGADYAAGLLAASVASLVDDARRRRGASNALLFLLLRQALMAQLLDSTLNILQLEGMLTPEARRRAGSSDEFLVRTLNSDVYATKWSYVFGALADLDGRFDVHFPATGLFPYLQSSSRTMADFLAQRGDNMSFNGYPGNALHLAERGELQQHADRIARVGQIAAPRLDALVREHLDLCSHRLDAWQLGLAVRRLGTQRAQTPTGVYLGAYGWLEDLRPKAQLPIAEGLPPALHRDGEAQVFADPENEGFIHAPSLTHAVTAAILRSAYLSETSQPDIEDAMAVNLSSRRVRQALELLDGVQAGNDLGALLGYRLEYELHEAYATQNVSFDTLIFELRRQYPGVAAVDPSTSVPETSRRLVVDGLSLLNSVRQWVEDNVPLAARRNRTLFEILSASATATLPLPAEALDAQHRQGVFQAIDGLADALDAVGDLSLSEAIFQIVRGNFPRAAAVVAALAEGRPVPRPQIAKTPRSGTTVVHRVLLPLPRFDGHALSSLEVADAAALAAARAAALPAGWSTPMAMSARANAEPGLNHWLGGLLGDPVHIICRFEDPADGAAVREVSAAQLGLQPLDLLAMLGPGLEDGAAELSARIAYWALPDDIDLGSVLEAGPRPAIVLRLEERGPAWSLANRSFAEIEPLLVEMQTMLGRARAATREDLLFDESVAVAPAIRAPSWNAGELGARAAEARARLRLLGTDLMAVLAGGPPGDDIDTIDAAAWARTHTAVFDDPAVLARTHELGVLVLRAADFGVTVALPPPRFETPEAVIAGLRASVANAFVQVVERLHGAAAAVDGNDPIEAMNKIFGKAFVAAPAFAITDGATIRAQLAATELLPPGSPFAIEGWLAGVATVREPIAALQRAWTLGEAFGAAGPTARPAQLPAQPGDPWFGLPFPTDYEPSSDKLSLVLLRADAWAEPDTEVSAILVDQWTETIPNRSETTGIAFHYDSPDAMPPQSLLLVVPPTVRGMWRWDDLVQTLHDTLDLARSRAVEPEHLAGEVYAQLLPAVTGELVPDHLGSSDAEVGGSRVILDFGINNAL